MQCIWDLYNVHTNGGIICYGYYFYDIQNAELTFLFFPLPILSFIIYKVSAIINKKSEITQKKQSRITSFVQEMFSGIRVLKAYNRSRYFAKQYDQETEDYKRASLSLALVNALFLPSIILLIGLHYFQFI